MLCAVTFGRSLAPALERYRLQSLKCFLMSAYLIHLFSKLLIRRSCPEVTQNQRETLFMFGMNIFFLKESQTTFFIN